MKKLILFTILLVLSCETTSENKEEKLNLNNSILILNQGNSTSGSSISLHKLDSNITRESIYKEVNGKDLGVYANHMLRSKEYILLTIAGFGGGSKVRILNTAIEELATIDAPAGLSAQFSTVVNEKLFVQYADWSTYAHKMYVYDFSESAIQGDKVIELDQFSIPSVGIMTESSSDIFLAASSNVYKIDASNYQMDTLSLSNSVNGLVYFDKNLYLSFTSYDYDADYGAEIRNRTPKGGFLRYSTDFVRLDSVSLARGSNKFLKRNNRIFLLTNSGVQKGTLQHASWGDYYSYDYSASAESIYEITESSSSKLFSSSGMNQVTRGNWINFSLVNEEYFLVPNYDDYVSNGKINMIDFNGNLFRSLDVKIGPCQFVILN